LKELLKYAHTCLLTSISDLHVSWPRTTVTESPLEYDTHLQRML